MGAKRLYAVSARSHVVPDASVFCVRNAVIVEIIVDPVVVAVLGIVQVCKVILKIPILAGTVAPRRGRILPEMKRIIRIYSRIGAGHFKNNSSTPGDVFSSERVSEGRHLVAVIVPSISELQIRIVIMPVGVVLVPGNKGR